MTMGLTQIRGVVCIGSGARRLLGLRGVGIPVGRVAVRRFPGSTVRSSAGNGPGGCVDAGRCGGARLKHFTWRGRMCSRIVFVIVSLELRASLFFEREPETHTEQTTN